MELSVVIPTYNQANLLRECLRSLVDQTLTPEDYEIILVDDGSTDQTQGVCSEFAQHIKTVRFPVNRGRSAARNAGIQQAMASIIVFLDSDVIVRPDFLEWHLRTHRQNGQGILSRGPVVLVSDPSAARTTRTPRVAASPAYLDTANAAVEKAALSRAGMFDEGFPGYGWEDFELGMRLKRLGIQRVFCREAVAFHVQPEDRWTEIPGLLQKEEVRARSAVYFYRKHPTLESRLLIQATPLHHLIYWLQTGGGILSPKNVTSVTQRLRRAGLSGLAYLILRGILNLHYVRSLSSEFRRHATALA